MMLRKTFKLLNIIGVALYRNCLFRFGVAAGIEHERVLQQLDCATVVDIGANRGQFSLVARKCFPSARIVSFEPLPGPAARYLEVFGADSNVSFHPVAIGPTQGQVTIHISQRDDSSSLLPITETQNSLFPGTAESETGVARVCPLDDVLDADGLLGPALLKIDVQGFELQVLKGSESLLRRFRWVYVECSFVELYLGQALADEVIAWLRDRNLVLCGIYNVSYDRTGRAIQGDFLFKQGAAKCVC